MNETRDSRLISENSKRKQPQQPSHKCHFLIFTLTIAFAITLISTFQIYLSEKPKQPNVLLIIGSSHSKFAINCYNNSFPTFSTPNLDKLCKEGMRFENAFTSGTGVSDVGASSTGNSFISMLTGESAVNGGVDRVGFNRLDHFFKSYKDLGYSTSIFGKLPIDRSNLHCDGGDCLDGIDNYEVLEASYGENTKFLDYANPSFIGNTGSVNSTLPAVDSITEYFKTWYNSLPTQQNTNFPWISTLYYPGPDSPWFSTDLDTDQQETFAIPRTFFEQLELDTTMKTRASELSTTKILDLVASWDLKLNMDHSSVQQNTISLSEQQICLNFKNASIISGKLEYFPREINAGVGAEPLEYTFGSGLFLEGRIVSGVFESFVIGLENGFDDNGVLYSNSSLVNFVQAGEITEFSLLADIFSSDCVTSLSSDLQLKIEENSIGKFNCSEVDVEIVEDSQLYNFTTIQCEITGVKLVTDSPFDQFIDKWELIKSNEDSENIYNDRDCENIDRCSDVKTGYGAYKYAGCDLGQTSASPNTCDFNPNESFNKFLENLSEKGQFVDYEVKMDERTLNFMEKLYNLRFEHELKHEIFQLFMNQYKIAVEKIDEEVGKVMDIIESEIDNTIVIYTSDVGFMLGQHGMVGSGLGYDPNLQIPLIIRNPSLTKQNQVNDEIVLSSDVGRTLLELSTAKFLDEKLKDENSKIDGQNLVQLLYSPNRTVSKHESFYFQNDQYPGWKEIRAYKGLRTKTYKYIEYFNPDEKADPAFIGAPDTWDFQKELYHLTTDPDEVHNVYGLREYSVDQGVIEAEFLVMEERFRDSIDRLSDAGFLVG